MTLNRNHLATICLHVAVASMVFGSFFHHTPGLMWAGLGLLLLSWPLMPPMREYQKPMLNCILPFSLVATASLIWSVNPDITLSFLKREILPPLLIVLLLAGRHSERLLATATLSGFAAIALALFLYQPGLPELLNTWQHELRYYDPGVGDLSTVLLLALPLAMLSRPAKGPLRVLFILLWTTLILYTAWLTSNRMFWAALAVALLIYTPLSGKFSSRQVGVALAGIAVLVFLVSVNTPKSGGLQGDQLQKLENTYTRDVRWQIWDYWMEVIAERPVLGYGYGRDLSADYNHVDKARHPVAKHPLVSHAHNIFLNIYASVGLPGLLAFLYMIAGVARQFMGGLGLAATRKSAVTGLLLLTIMLVKNLTDDFYTRGPLILFWVLLVLAWNHMHTRMRQT
ncbi:O-antigen ligase family protein [Hahella sp. SMD15-11]|uniref:O-antigen ligase family protein n=1 Tax=Thermohahella caldifontis TaxID=3142973 RepID=A0AB39UWE2_9GAMM